MANVPNYNFSYNNPYGMSKPQGQSFNQSSSGKPGGDYAPVKGGGGAPVGKMFTGDPASEQVSWDNPGMQVSPQQNMGGFSGAEPAPNTLQPGGSFGGSGAPMPQFNNGQIQQGAYGQQLNRFMGRGGSFDQFRPRMGAQGPQYRNGMSARPFTPPPPQPPKPPDENINPPPPVEYKSYVQPTFNMGY